MEDIDDIQLQVMEIQQNGGTISELARRENLLHTNRDRMRFVLHRAHLCCISRTTVSRKSQSLRRSRLARHVQIALPAVGDDGASAHWKPGR